MKILTMLFIAIVFIVLREFWTWYLKLNTITKQNDEIIRLLKKLAGESDLKTTAEKSKEITGNL